jgi:hypothetical protein
LEVEAAAKQDGGNREDGADLSAAAGEEEFHQQEITGK